MLRTIIIALDVDDTEDPLVTDEDLVDGIRARLDEFYPSVNGYPFVPTKVEVAVTDPDAYRLLLAAADVGIEGRFPENEDEEADLDVVHAADALRSLVGSADR